jgi:hypothetical protein
MIRRITPCMAILPPAQTRLWPELRPVTNLGFTLYGGTAIALRLGHRPSINFDFFSEKLLDREKLNAALPFLKRSTVLQETPNTLSILVPFESGEDTRVRISFFGGIGFGRVGEPDMTEDGVLSIASCDDLLATKVKVILQRVEAKDYRDIAAMIRAGVRLDRGLAAAQALYGATFQPSESLKALVYFEGGDLHTLSQEDKHGLVETVRAIRGLPGGRVLARELGFPAHPS